MGIKNIEIAKQLNISTAAVSLARNNRPGVSATTRALWTNIMPHTPQRASCHLTRSCCLWCIKRMGR